MNGRGNITRFQGIENSSPIPDIYSLHFNKSVSPGPEPSPPKKYLLRIINTSFDTTYVFSIDNHWLQIISADFVPIEPYRNTSLLIGIGQRYNVIVEAKPDGPSPQDGNFWIRTWTAEGCGIKSKQPGYEKTGILRYNTESTADPVSQSWPGISLKCSDETYTSLKPVYPWYVGEAANGKHGEQFGIAAKGPKSPTFPLAVFSLNPEDTREFVPL